MLYGSQGKEKREKACKRREGNTEKKTHCRVKNEIKTKKRKTRGNSKCRKAQDTIQWVTRKEEETKETFIQGATGHKKAESTKQEGISSLISNEKRRRSRGSPKIGMEIVENRIWKNSKKKKNKEKEEKGCLNSVGWQHCGRGSVTLVTCPLIDKWLITLITTAAGALTWPGLSSAPRRNPRRLHSQVQAGNQVLAAN